MTTSIPSNGLPQFTQLTGNTANGAAGKSTDGAGSVTTTAKSDDQLKLTDSARALQEAARPDDSSAIDSQRVDRIRQSLADGSYKIDAGQIADRMLAMERQIGGTDQA